jgi:hypothetical protein
VTTKRKLAPSAEAAPEYGPCMRQLPNDRWRRFVEHFVMEKPGSRGAAVAAAKHAGFGKAGTSALNFARISSRLVLDARIQAAIAEESRRIYRAAAPATVAAAVEIIKNPEHRDHGRIVEGLLDRLDPATTRHEVAVDVSHHDDTALLVLQMLLEQGMTFEQAQSMIGANRPFDLVAAWQRLGGKMIEGEVTDEAEHEKPDLDALGFAPAADTLDTGNPR